MTPPLRASEEISDSILSRETLSGSSPDTTGEKTKASITGQVSVESTSNSGGEVETKIPLSQDNGDSVSRRVLSEPSQTPSRSGQDEVVATVSPTLSAESLLSDSEAQADTISLSHSSASAQSLSSSSLLEPEASASPSSIVISVPSISSSMSSISSSSILPSASTTSAPGEIVTTTPLADEDLVLFETVPVNAHAGHDFRGQQPKTVEVTASKTSNVMEMTVPSYDRANPNRVGLLDGGVEEEDDHFLSLRAPQSGGPLNQARAATDGLAGLRREEDKTAVKKNNRRAEPGPGPDISDILSGLLNVVGEGLSIATNYVQETNKKKAQEKVSTGDTQDVKPKPPPVLSLEEEEEKKKNNSRINNRGPPLLAARPFEAIPLEILQNQRPGAKPGVSIPQRPFQTHLPPGISGPAPTITSPGISGGAGGGSSPPFKSGVPLPQQLVPTQAGPTQGESDAGLPTRPGYSPDFSLGGDDAGDETQPELTTVNTGKANKNRIKQNKKRIPPLPPLPPLPEIKPVSTDPFIDLLLNEIKEGKLTTFPSSTTTRTRPTSRVTPRPPEELQPSFSPPVLVTPPATPRVRPRPPNRRPWPGGRPPTPSRPSRPKDSPPFVKKYPDWKYQPRPQSSFPTPPLNTKVSKKPLVFPTRRFPTRPGAVITGVAIPADNDVFDLTVTAQQNFGGARKTKSKYQGRSCKITVR